MTLSFSNKTKKSASQSLLKLVLATASVAVIANPLITTSAVAAGDTNANTDGNADLVINAPAGTEMEEKALALGAGQIPLSGSINTSGNRALWPQDNIVPWNAVMELYQWQKKYNNPMGVKEIVQGVYFVRGTNKDGEVIKVVVDANDIEDAQLKMDKILQKEIESGNPLDHTDYIWHCKEIGQEHFITQLDLISGEGFQKKAHDAILSAIEEDKVSTMLEKAKRVELVKGDDPTVNDLENALYDFTANIYLLGNRPSVEQRKNILPELEKWLAFEKEMKMSFSLGLNNIDDFASLVDAKKHPTLAAIIASTGSKAYSKKARQVGRKYSSADGANFAMDAIESEFDTRELARIAAVAAGDDQVWSKGIWARGSFGSSVQKPTTGHAGNRGNVAGGTIGFEVENDCGTLYGLSYTHAYGKYVFKDDADKAKINFNVFSLYGEHEVNDNILLRGILSYSANRIKTEDNREDPEPTITASFRGNTYSVDLMAGYKMEAGEFNLMPFMQTRYNRNTQNAYEDSAGTKFNKKSSDAWTGKLGLRASKAITHDSGAIFTPYLSGSAQYDLSVDSQEVVAFDADGIPINLNANKENGKFERPRFGYNLGGGLIVEHGKIEVSAAYKGHFRKNFHSHQGSLKLKVAL